MKAMGATRGQVLMASYVEDRIQRSFYMVRMSAPPPAPLGGSPEAIGKADYLETVIQDITSMLGITSGLWQARRGGRIKTKNLAFSTKKNLTSSGIIKRLNY